MKIVLDASPLSQLVNPRRPQEIYRWLESMWDGGHEVIVPAIADYETRRNLILERKGRSIDLLDDLRSTLTYLPITDADMLMAADLWAEVRRIGRPTADRHALDADVILAAQAIAAGAVVATENVGHLARFVTAEHWSRIV